MASWSIVTTIKESEMVTLRFVAYHLEMGADHAYIYLDDPNDPAYPNLINHPKITVIICDEKHWNDRIGKARPNDQELRQAANANHAYSELQSDWLMLLDGDELLISTKGSIAEELDAQHASMVRATPMEPVFVESSDDRILFFSPLDKVIGRTLVSQLYPRVPRDLFIEHSIGKSLVRRGLKKLRFRIHRAEFPNWREQFSRTSNLRLLHFVNFGVENWTKKYERRITDGKLYPFGFNRDGVSDENHQIRFYTEIAERYALDGLDGLKALFKDTKKLDIKILSELVASTQTYEFKFDFGKALYEQLGYGDGSQTNLGSIFDWGT